MEKHKKIINSFFISYFHFPKEWCFYRNSIWGWGVPFYSDELLTSGREDHPDGDWKRMQGKAGDLSKLLGPVFKSNRERMLKFPSN